MTATTTRTQPQVIASYPVQAQAQGDWYAFQGNPCYSHLQATPLVYLVQVKRTVNGEWYVSTSYDPDTTQVHTHDPAYRSNAFATEAEARQDANRVWLYLRDVFVSEHYAHAMTTVAVDHQGLTKGRTWTGDVFGGPCPLPDGSAAYQRQTLCPDCQHFDTLTTRDTGYGWATTCTTPDCRYDDYVSSGD